MAGMSGIAVHARCMELNGPPSAAGRKRNELGVGIALKTGNVTIGEIGQFCKDFTAIGEVVNVAARLQGAARPGEVLMSETVYEQVEDLLPEAVGRSYTLKGVSKPVQAYVLAPTANTSHVQG